MDLFDFADSNEIAEDKQAQEKSILTVSQLTRKIRNLIEYRVGAVWVEGEISNLRKQTSGHQYFTLKDKGSRSVERKKAGQPKARKKTQFSKR